MQLKGISYKRWADPEYSKSQGGITSPLFGCPERKPLAPFTKEMLSAGRRPRPKAIGDGIKDRRISQAKKVTSQSRLIADAPRLTRERRWATSLPPFNTLPGQCVHILFLQVCAPRPFCAQQTRLSFSSSCTSSYFVSLPRFKILDSGQKPAKIIIPQSLFMVSQSFGGCVQFRNPWGCPHRGG